MEHNRCGATCLTGKACRHRVKVAGERCYRHKDSVQPTQASSAGNPPFIEVLMANGKPVNEPHRCGGVRPNGVLCRQPVKIAGTRCFRHEPKIQVQAPDQVLELPRRMYGGRYPLLTDTLNLIGSWDEHTERWTGRIGAVIDRGPSKGDRPGFIYMYKWKHDTQLEDKTYRKIGRTKDEVKDRIAEWGNPTLVMAWGVRYNEFAERLIHLFLDAHRVNRRRITDSKDYMSSWKNSGDWIDDANLSADRSGLDRKKEVEWFLGHEHYLRLVCQTIISRINSWE